MAFRFRNSIRLAPGIRLNLGKRGVSLSAGVKGASVTLGKNGLWGNVGAPGTGLSYRTRLSGSPAHQRRVKRERQRHTQQNDAQKTNEFTAFKASLDEKGQVSLCDQNNQPLSSSQRKLVWSDYADKMETWLLAQMDKINGEMDLLLDIHQDIVPPESAIPQYEAVLFDEPAPIKPTLSAYPEPPTKPELKLRFWDKLIPGRKRHLLDHQEQALHQWESAMKVWRHACADIDASYQQRLQHYEVELSAWQTASATHAKEQEQRAARFVEGLKNDEQLIAEILTAELDALDWPRETLVDFDIDTAKKRIYLDVDLPEIEDMPKRNAEWGAHKRRLLIKDKSSRQLREEYARHIHGIILRLAGVVLAVVPDIEQVVISGYSQRLDTATGHTNDDYLVSVAIDKSKFAELNFAQLDCIDPIAAIEQFSLIRNMTKTGIFRPIVPITPN